MSAVTDYIFVYVSAFALGFTWARYYLRNNLVCLFVAIAAAAVAGIIYDGISRKKKRCRSLSAKESKALSSLGFQLISNPKAVNIVADLYVRRGYEVTFLKNVFLADNGTEKIVAVVCFSRFPSSPDEIIPAFSVAKTFGSREIVVFTAKTAAESLGFPLPDGFSLRTICLPELKTLLDNAGITPEPTFSFSEKPKLPKKLARALSRERSGAYFGTGLLLLATGFIAFFPVWYFVAASVSLGLALYSRFNSRFNSHSTFFREPA